MKIRGKPKSREILSLFNIIFYELNNWFALKNISMQHIIFNHTSRIRKNC